jgi:hypothetical protein
MPANYYSDNEAAFTAEFITQKNYLKYEEKLKSGITLYCYATPRSTLKVFIGYDKKQWKLLGTITENPQRFDLGVEKFYYFRLKVVESSSNEPFQFDGYTIEYNIEEEKR